VDPAYLMEVDTLYLSVPLWLLLLFLGIAAFAPVAGRWPGWWLGYYGALLACWVLVAIAAFRQAAREDREAQRVLARRLRQLREPEQAVLIESNTGADAAPSMLVHRRVIVARDKADEYDEIRRRDGDDDVIVIVDRRKIDRRQRAGAYVVERRRAERRRHDIQPLLFRQGWAEVRAAED
jgi:hypothetical protein